MFFGSKRTYISKKMINKIQSPDINIAPEAKPRVNLKQELSVIPEEKSSSSVKDSEEIKKPRDRSRSLSSVSDEDLDEFHSDEEAPPQQKIPPQEESAPKKSGGIFGGLFSMFSSSKEHSEELKAPQKKSTKRRREAAERQGYNPPAEAMKDIGPAMPVPLSVATGSAGVKHEQEVDTNVLSLNLSVLKDKTQIATGDPVVCTKCKAFFNIHSKIIKDPVTNEQTWKCEFCNTINKVSLEEEEIPKSDQLTYVIESAQQAMIKKGGSEDISIIFCIDVSGSMCVTQQVQGKIALRYDKTSKMKDLMKFSDGSEQFLSGENKNQTYISRMQCLQTAIEKQLNELSFGAPKRKVGIVTFNNDVTLIGDGAFPPKVITGDKLLDYEGLLDGSQKDAESYITKTIAETKANLITRIGQIEEMGQTALGPAMLVALGLASKGTPGSKIIICTDGLANVGLGSIEDLGTEEKFNAAKGFYTKVGELAKSRGVSVSIISIVGEECLLEMLSPLADLTAGDILKVNPLNLSQDFANILSENIIATSVEVRVKLHKGLTFRNEDVKNISEDGTLLIKPIGNATDGQEVTLEYCLKPSSEIAKMADIDFSSVKQLPFQTQISYLSLDGMKCKRLITQNQEITFEKEQAKKEANFKVLGVNAVQQTAKLAKEGNLRKAQANAYHWKKMMKGSEEYEDYMVNAAPLYDALQQQQVINYAQSPQVMLQQPLAQKFYSMPRGPIPHQAAEAQPPQYHYNAPGNPGMGGMGSLPQGYPAQGMAPQQMFYSPQIPRPTGLAQQQPMQQQMFSSPHDNLVSLSNQAQKMNLKRMQKK